LIYGGIFDVEDAKKGLVSLQQKSNQPGFWSNQNKAQNILRQINTKQDIIDRDEKLLNMVDEIDTYINLMQEDDSGLLFEEASQQYVEYSKLAQKMEMEFLLGKETDKNDAMLVIHPGAGGTESQDWAEMLMRMYKRWAESNDFRVSIDDLQPGDEAGIKSVTMEIGGDYAYGYLKSEIGVHRLVRISPFNAQGKRQTSFASVFVYPIIDDSIEIDINTNDLKIDTYRASGAGGQHINTTDSAIRITHIPTNIVVQCQKERSQIKNKETAMKLLKSRLYRYYEEKLEEEKLKTEKSKSDIGWGNQIRSYVFHPYQMVKDHRTNHETGNSEAVLDGVLEDFIFAYLKSQATVS